MGSIPLVPARDISDLLAPQGARRQSLEGFDADYADIVDYIVRCTHRIWEGKDLALIRTHYSQDCVLHTLAGEVKGVEAVVANTVKTLAAFPDRLLYADSVIWGGNDQAGFYSSHRITSPMTNLGDSDFGAATGRRVRVVTIADCAVKANRIYEEWLVRDNLSLVLQLRLDPHEIAARQARAERDSAPGTFDWRDREIERVRSVRRQAPVLSARGEADTAAAERVMRSAAATFDAIWGARQFERVRTAYSPLCVAFAPSGRRLFGHGEIIGFAVHLLGALPDARVSVDHVCAVPWGAAGYDVAVRWTLAGTHSGAGWLRAPTGLPILVLGVTHSRIRDGRIVEEWTVFDELAVLRQMYRSDGA